MKDIQEFLEACKKYFKELNKDFCTEAKSEASCWFTDEVANDDKLFERTAKEIALKW